VEASGETARRTAAALLFPVEGLEPLMGLVLRKTFSFEAAANIKEDE